jgi:hypothetical protein
MCHVLPMWIDGDYLWTTPMFPDAEMVVGYGNAPHLRSLKDLRTSRSAPWPATATRASSRCWASASPAVDAPSMEHNLQSVTRGEALHHHQRSHAGLRETRRRRSLKLRPDLVFAAFKTQCACRAAARCRSPTSRVLESCARTAASTRFWRATADYFLQAHPPGSSSQRIGPDIARPVQRILAFQLAGRGRHAARARHHQQRLLAAS